VKGLAADSVVVVPAFEEVLSPSTVVIVKAPVLLIWTAPALLLNARFEVTVVKADVRPMPPPARIARLGTVSEPPKPSTTAPFVTSDRVLTLTGGVMEALTVRLAETDELPIRNTLAVISP